MADSPAPQQDPDKGYVVLRDTENRPVWYKPEDVSKGLAVGFRRETVEEAKDRELRAWASDNPTLAGAAAAARTLSFGATGFIKPQTQRVLAEENPAATTLGEIGGLALPFAGEAGLASKAARILSESKAVRNAGTVLDTVAKAAGAPMAAASKVGQVVGGAAGAALGSKALGTAARFAAESELYNIGANIGEAALGDEELTADRLLAHSGSALALGAGLGLAGAGVAAGVSKLLNKSNAGIEKAQRFFREEYPQVQTMQDAALAAKEAYVDAATKMSGRDRPFVEQMVSGINTPEGMATRERLTKLLTPGETDALGRAVLEPLQESLETTKKALSEKAWGEIGKAQVEKLIGPRPLEPIMQGAQDTFAALRKLEQAAIETPERFDRAMLAKFNDAYNGFEDAIKGVVTQTAEGETRVIRARAKNAAEVFDNMIELRKHLSDMVTYDKPLSKLTTAERNTDKLIRDARGAITEHLRNPALYGEGAAARASLDELNTEFSRYVGRDSQFAKLFTNSKTGKVDAIKLATYLRQIDAFRGAGRTEALDDFFATMKSFNDRAAALAKQVDVAYETGKLTELHGKTTAARDIAAERLRENAKLRQMTNDTTSIMERRTLGIAGGAAVGALLGGPAGAIAGAGIQHAYAMLRDPVLAGRTILALERLNAKVDGEVRKGITGFLGTAARTAAKAAKATGKAAVRAGRMTADVAERAGTPASVFAMRDMLDSFDKKDLPKVQGGDKNDSARMRDFRQLEALLIELTTNPERAYDRYADALKSFQAAAPNITHRVIEKQLEAAHFLYSKMPKNPSYGKTLNDAINDWRPSDQDVAKFERYVKSAQDPLSVLDDMQHGRLTREGVETLQALYPALYKSIQDVTFENLATLQRRLPYTQRINLSLLLNAPVDPSVTPSFVATMQGFYQGSVQSQIQGQQGGATKAAGRGGSAIHPSQLKSFGASHLTGAQRITYKSSLLGK